MPRTVKPRRGRPQKLEDDVKVLTVRLSKSTYGALEQLAAKRTIKTGSTVRLSDVVRDAIDNALTNG